MAKLFAYDIEGESVDAGEIRLLWCCSTELSRFSSSLASPLSGLSRDDRLSLLLLLLLLFLFGSGTPSMYWGLCSLLPLCLPTCGEASIGISSSPTGLGTDSWFPISASYLPI